MLTVEDKWRLIIYFEELVLIRDVEAYADVYLHALSWWTLGLCH